MSTTYPFIERCEGCGKTHRTEFAHHACLSLSCFHMLLKYDGSWDKDGSTIDIISVPESNPLYYKVRPWIWGAIAWNIYRRDKYHCTDCGRDVSTSHLTYEAHHIIPRHRGGTEHPANLRTLCSECHRKYTNELLESIAADRKMEKLALFSRNHPPLESYFNEV
jgi:5-methylcytosine-specific restriction endonuclease McrA